MNKAEEIRDIAWGLGGQVREHYSGRFMYGKTCMGIVTDEPTAVIEEAASRGLRGALTDGMGLDTIVYWTGVQSDQENDEDL